MVTQENRRSIRGIIKPIDYGYTQQSYAGYLRSPHWRTLVYQAKREQYPCYVCGGLIGIEVHHIDYSHLGSEEFYVDIYPVCSKHHTGKLLSCHYTLGTKIPTTRKRLWVQMMLLRALHALKRGKLGLVVDCLWYAWFW